MTESIFLLSEPKYLTVITKIHNLLKIIKTSFTKMNTILYKISKLLKKNTNKILTIQGTLMTLSTKKKSLMKIKK
jgi:hypothetical protein